MANNKIIQIPKALYSGEVDLNGFNITSSVLDDGRRIFSERSLATAFGIKGSGAYWQKKREAKSESAFLPEYLSAKYLQPFINSELREKFESAIFSVLFFETFVQVEQCNRKFFIYMFLCTIMLVIISKTST